jgi:xylulokinase
MVFLGLDSSTQSLTAILINTETRQILHEASVHFDRDLAEYGTVNGVLQDEDPKIVHAPPILWVDALDRLLSNLRSDGVDLGKIAAVSGSGQQHGSVYLNAQSDACLSGLNPSLPLAEQLRPCFSRATSPIWMDSSTTSQCEEIRNSLGGAATTSEATGSSTFERFTGPQVRKFFQEEAEAYEATAHIALVSSFMASILAGRIAPIDHGDGAGMNLMDIRGKCWHPKALQVTAPGLSDRLPLLAEPWADLGSISGYFVEKHGFHSDTRVIAWSGDNPNSVAGVGLVEPGRVAISLGTSDTYFGTMAACRTDPQGEGHVFGSPTGDYMTLICFKNGSLARERVRDMYHLDWAGFSAALCATPPGNDGKMMLPWFEPEIVPRVLVPGEHRRNLETSDGPGNCRAVVEAQMISMRIHSEWMGIRPALIYATGGASANREILQIMADVQGCPVCRSDVSNSAALGAALRAAHGFYKAKGKTPEWGALVSGFTDPVADFTITPDSNLRMLYDRQTELYRDFEKENIC